MCDPVSMMVASTGMQVVGGITQGNAAKRAANEQAAWDEYQGKAARAEAELEARRIRRAGASARGETLAAVAASGVKIGEGGALDAERQVMQDYETDAAMAILSGQRAQASANAQASQRRRAGRDAQRAGYFSAATSLMSAAATMGRAKQPPAPVETRDPTFGGYGGRF